MAERHNAYKEAGVDIEVGNTFVSRIKSLVGSTFTKGVVSDIGGFGGLFRLDTSGMEEPLLVASTDGVGTKLKLAFAFNRHETIGIDLVAMSVNDILVQGAVPLFFLDYFATGKLELETAEKVVSGIAAGCRQAGCALIGGETAEMPDFYNPGEYDLSGFCVGVVDRSRLLDGSGIEQGDCVIGIASSGLHSNGYSLVRKLYAEAGLTGEDPFPGSDRTVAEVLLEPTRIYSDMVRELLRQFSPKGMVHITGGGFYDNIPRILPDHLQAAIRFGTWDMLPVFTWLQNQGKLSWPEMLQIFNCGIGFVVIAGQDQEKEILSSIQGSGHAAWRIGEIENRADSKGDQVIVRF